MKFILGKKREMVQFYAPDGTVHPATIVDAGPITVTQIKTNEKDGYTALQVGYGNKKESRTNKPQLGHFKNLGPFQDVVEFDAEIEGVNVGDTMNASVFAEGDTVVVTGISKGKGFQGVVKRHGFHGGPRSHGQKHSEREPGSIGGGLRNRVPKGMRMAGRMGQDRIHTKNLTVLAVNAETNTMLIKGALPGRRGTLLEITAK
jgi:large subunit ribosomal protein L3